MGGCRCTYRNCTSRTDGKTHMFHYPVFDKVRCHQWLTNAHKLEFLNLKVSQLKNRVVCQHHFKDENFMNFKKDKLTFDAVPTEDGPYCDTSQSLEPKVEPDTTKVYNITLEDIENEYLTLNDKRANFSVKYGDFLTNGDLLDLNTMSHASDNTQVISKDRCFDDSTGVLNDNINRNKTVAIITNPPQKNNTVIIDNIFPPNAKDAGIKNETQQLDALPVFEPTNPIMNADMFKMNVVPIEYGNEQPNQNELNKNQGFDVIVHKTKQPNENINERKKIRIISEKRQFSEPVSLIGKLEPVSPSTVLPLPNRKKHLNVVRNDSIMNSKVELNISGALENNTFVSEQNRDQEGNVAQSRDPRSLIKVEVVREPLGIVNLEPERVPIQITNLDQSYSESNPITTILESKKSNRITFDQTQNELQKLLDVKKSKAAQKNNSQVPKSSLLKCKMPPERVAAIQEKRKFNMKLRDIVENCLDKLDDQDKVNENRKLLQKIKMKDNNMEVGTYLAKEPALPSVNEYTITYLEARMKKMENILLNKIDQNSQRIVELKQTFVQPQDKKTAHTQTVLSEELHKKQLYQEISKYLSPEANSLIYEELFINKFKPEAGKGAPLLKRRKYR